MSSLESNVFRHGTFGGPTVVNSGFQVVEKIELPHGLSPEETRLIYAYRRVREVDSRAILIFAEALLHDFRPKAQPLRLALLPVDSDNRELSDREHRAHNALCDAAQCARSLHVIGINHFPRNAAGDDEVDVHATLSAFLTRIEKDLCLLIAMFNDEEQHSVELFRGVGE